MENGYSKLQLLCHCHIIKIDLQGTKKTLYFVNKGIKKRTESRNIFKYERKSALKPKLL